jgi:hypothetical protein
MRTAMQLGNDVASTVVSAGSTSVDLLKAGASRLKKMGTKSVSKLKSAIESGQIIADSTGKLVVNSAHKISNSERVRLLAYIAEWLLVTGLNKVDDISWDASRALHRRETRRMEYEDQKAWDEYEKKYYAQFEDPEPPSSNISSTLSTLRSGLSTITGGFLSFANSAVTVTNSTLTSLSDMAYKQPSKEKLGEVSGYEYSNDVDLSDYEEEPEESGQIVTTSFKFDDEIDDEFDEGDANTLRQQLDVEESRRLRHDRRMPYTPIDPPNPDESTWSKDRYRGPYQPDLNTLSPRPFDVDYNRTIRNSIQAYDSRDPGWRENVDAVGASQQFQQFINRRELTREELTELRSRDASGQHRWRVRRPDEWISQDEMVTRNRMRAQTMMSNQIGDLSADRLVRIAGTGYHNDRETMITHALIEETHGIKTLVHEEHRSRSKRAEAEGSRSKPKKVKLSVSAPGESHNAMFVHNTIQSR